MKGEGGSKKVFLRSESMLEQSQSGLCPPFTPSHPHTLTPSHCRQSTTCFSGMPPHVGHLHLMCDERKWLSSFVAPAAGHAGGRTHLAEGRGGRRVRE